MSQLSVAAELTRYGPEARGSDRPTLSAAHDYCRRLAQGHYENFTVASWLLPRPLLPHFQAIYAYCRWADDLADEISDRRQSLTLLDWWREELEQCYGGLPRHPVFVALQPTIEEFSIPRDPFTNLLIAFRQDQQVTRYATPEAVVEYCQNSANPVGRLILYLGRCHDEAHCRLSDAVCTGLQLANFCQDVARDWNQGRIYLPRTTLEQAGYSEAMFARGECNEAFRQAMRVEVDRAESYLRAGEPLADLMPAGLRLDVALFVAGGLKILQAIRDLDYNVWRPTPDGLEMEPGEPLSALLVAHAASFEPGVAAMSDMLTASYAHCRRLARGSSSSFYYSFLLLPKRKRLAMCALYAFLRRTDDLGDSLDPVAQRRLALQHWKTSLHRAMQGQCDDPLLPALADTVMKFQIPLEYLDAVIEGVEMDLEPKGYDTFEQLETYCYRVASVVGLACLRIWGVTNVRAEALAHHCGVAFQMTNILRDLNEDAARQRIYLPREDLICFSYTADDLSRGVRDDRFRQLMRFEIERTEKFYAEAAEIQQWLEPDGQRVFGSMLAVYRALLHEIKRHDGDVLSTRIRLSKWRKLRIATRWFLFRAPAKAPTKQAAGIVAS